MNFFIKKLYRVLAVFFFVTSLSIVSTGKVQADNVLSNNVAGVSKAQAAKFAAGSTRLTVAKVAKYSKAIRGEKKLICFDLDGTLTQHKTQLTEANKETLDALAKKYKIIMVGAGNALRIYKQMNDYPIDIVANYGMQESKIVNGTFTIIRDEKCKVDSAFFIKNCDNLRKKYGYTQYEGDPIEFQESGMVTFGLLGTKATSADKLKFDPDKKKRRAMYPEMLRIFKDYSVYIGGTTSFDIAKKQYNKYSAVMRYAKEHGYSKNQVLFVGDDFGDGGGDSHIRLGGIDYIQIYDFTKIPERLSFLYK